MKFDVTDLKIMNLIQDNAEISLDEISKQVNLSSTPCWKRISKIRNSGMFDKQVTLFNRNKTGLGVRIILLLKTDKHNLEWVEKFTAFVCDCKNVTGLYRIGGELDYILNLVFSEIGEYDQFYKNLIALEGIVNASACFVMEEIKNTHALPLTLEGIQQK